MEQEQLSDIRLYDKEKHKQSLLDDSYISPEIIYKVPVFLFVNSH